MIRNTVVRGPVSMFELIERLKEPTVRRRRQTVPMAGTLPPAELQRLLAIGIGEDGFREWFLNTPPRSVFGTDLHRAWEHLNAQEHVVWMSGGRLPFARQTLLYSRDPLCPAVALSYLRIIVDALGVKA